ncbi:O-antigen ligase family protein [Amylibacter sp.]|nr:O-antigen ligase family protein [Amylibacter sp.]
MKRAQSHVNFLVLATIAIQALTLHASFVLMMTIGINEDFLLIRVIAMPIVFVAFTIALLNSNQKFTHLDTQILLILLSILLLGLVIALIENNSLRYIAGDVIRLMVPWMAYFSIRIVSKDENYKHATNSIIKACLLIGIVDAFLIIASGTVFQSIRISSDLFLILLPVALLNLSSKVRITDILLLILVATCVVYTGKRATLVGVIILTTMTFYLKGLNTRFIIISLLLITPIGMVLLVAGDELQIQRFDYFTVQAKSLTNLAEDQSIWGRFYEYFNIIGSYREKPYSYVTGQGFGAEVEMTYSTGVYSINNKMHHAHSAFLVYYWRNGLLGLLLLAIIIKKIYSSVKSTRYQNLSNQEITVIALSVYGLALAVKSNYMLENIFFGVLLAILPMKLTPPYVNSENTDNAKSIR